MPAIDIRGLGEIPPKPPADHPEIRADVDCWRREVCGGDSVYTFHFESALDYIETLLAECERPQIFRDMTNERLSADNDRLQKALEDLNDPALSFTESRKIALAALSPQQAEAE